jgi:hypothetical protein
MSLMIDELLYSSATNCTKGMRHQKYLCSLLNGSFLKAVYVYITTVFFYPLIVNVFAKQVAEIFIHCF